MSGATSFWLPRVATQLIAALTEQQRAAAEGDAHAAREYRIAAQRLARVAWTALDRKPKTPPPIGTPVIRTELRRGEISLQGKALKDHPAYPPARWWPV